MTKANISGFPLLRKNLVSYTSLLWIDERFFVSRKATFIAYVSSETAMIWSYKKSMIQESKNLTIQESESQDLNILEYEKFLNYCSLLTCELLAFTFPPLLLQKSRGVAARRGLSRHSFFFFFLRNKYVSPGKQEAISTGLADEAIPAIP